MKKLDKNTIKHVVIGAIIFAVTLVVIELSGAHWGALTAAAGAGAAREHAQGDDGDPIDFVATIIVGLIVCIVWELLT